MGAGLASWAGPRAVSTEGSSRACEGDDRGLGGRAGFLLITRGVIGFVGVSLQQKSRPVGRISRMAPQVVLIFVLTFHSLLI